MPTTCAIEFDQPNGVYYSGQTLHGRVRLSTDKVKSARAVHIQVNGTGKVRWEERKSRQVDGKTQTYTVVYSSHDNYLASRVYVAGSEGGQSFDLPPGIHEYTFSVYLPPELPTSFTGQYGEIKYDVTVTIDRALRFDNVFKEGFTVIKQLDLNLNQGYLIPQEAEEVKYFCCWCCASGPVKSKLTVPFGGYAPGQTIKYKVHICNEANNDIEGCVVKLIQKVTFISRSPSDRKIVQNEIAKERLPGALRLTNKEHSGSIVIPSLVPSSNNPSAIIKIEYHILGLIETGACHNNDELFIPIDIGTVPLMASAQHPENITNYQPSAPLMPEGQSNGDLPPPYVPMAPPSFEDALAQGEKFDDKDRDPHQPNVPFIPKYPMYNNFSEPLRQGSGAAPPYPIPPSAPGEDGGQQLPYPPVPALPNEQMIPGWNVS